MSMNRPTMTEKKANLTRRWASALLAIKVARLSEADETEAWAEWVICDYAASFLPNAEKDRIHQSASRLADDMFLGYEINAGLRSIDELAA
jgi:hypothetical protein